MLKHVYLLLFFFKINFNLKLLIFFSLSTAMLNKKKINLNLIFVSCVEEITESTIHENSAHLHFTTLFFYMTIFFKKLGHSKCKTRQFVFR